MLLHLYLYNQHLSPAITSQFSSCTLSLGDGSPWQTESPLRMCWQMYVVKCPVIFWNFEQNQLQSSYSSQDPNTLASKATSTHTSIEEKHPMLHKMCLLSLCSFSSFSQIGVFDALHLYKQPLCLLVSQIHNIFKKNSGRKTKTYNMYVAHFNNNFLTESHLSETVSADRIHDVSKPMQWQYWKFVCSVVMC